MWRAPSLAAPPAAMHALPMPSYKCRTRRRLALTLVLTAGAFPICAAPAAAQQSLDDRLRAVMDRPEFRHASWGVEFYDLTARLPVFSLNAERLFVPGSSTKLLTTGTSLELLGRDHRFHTRVYRTGPVRGGT